jgi:hypothetical protein
MFPIIEVNQSMSTTNYSQARQHWKAVIKLEFKTGFFLLKLKRRQKKHLYQLDKFDQFVST